MLRNWLKFPGWVRVVWNPLCLDPYDGVFGWYDLAALLRLPHLRCLFVCVGETA